MNFFEQLRGKYFNFGQRFNFITTLHLTLFCNNRLIHLDLKSCPLKVDYLKQVSKSSLFIVRKRT